MTINHKRIPQVRVLIAAPLESDLIDQLRSLDDRLEIRWEPDLLPPPPYPSDHRGAAGFQRNAEQEGRWRALISEAEILFGIPGGSPEGLAEAVRTGPRLRWVQATAAGAGQQVAAATLSSEDLDRVMITSADGVQAGPLSEFALFGLLAFARDLPRLLEDKEAHRWRHHPATELRGRTVVILGVGAVGTEIARLTHALGMRTIGVSRQGLSDSPYLYEVRSPNDLRQLLPRADAVVVTLPLTDQTHNLLGSHAIAAIKPGAVLVNVGRGGVVDEPALIHALASGRLSGAALDGFATEPLDPDSPLWGLPNVIISPHTAALAEAENARIVSVFADNLRRYLAGDPLRNRVDPSRLY
ncbi:MAG TPA: D-2-hydroxyacid dehydrogenase [Acidimicrobiales bacterium]|jgi:phosphoglycerate dehydrogenase-like enzyme|nr:D-2-hydroxyacid dehydrogenase [Acidimicrobiales bacterium]